jgi:hypothetical protein
MVPVAVGAVTALVAVELSADVPADLPPQALTMDVRATALRRGIQSVIHALTTSALLRQILLLLKGGFAVRVGQKGH